MSPTAERRMTIDFTDSYYDTELTVVVRKDSAFASARSLAIWRARRSPDR